MKHLFKLIKDEDNLFNIFLGIIDNIDDINNDKIKTILVFNKYIFEILKLVSPITIKVAIFLFSLMEIDNNTKNKSKIVTVIEIIEKIMNPKIIIFDMLLKEVIFE